MEITQWISEHETHPPVEECGGVDYAAIYQYLACLCQGEAPPDINLQSSRRVRGLLDSLTTVLQQHDLEKNQKDGIVPTTLAGVFLVARFD